MTDVNAVIRWHEVEAELWLPGTDEERAHRAMAQALREMQEERDRLRSAVGPFADAADFYIEDNPEDAVVRYFFDSRTGERRAITIGHLRAARRALSPNQAEP